MLLQPGQGMGLLGAYNTGYTPINPQMNHYNSLLGRISGLSFGMPSGPMGPVANYFDGNTLMSGSTGQPVYNLPAGAGQQYGTTQSYMDTLGRMPTNSSEIVSPYIYYRPQTDISKIQDALKEQETKKVEEAMRQILPGGGGEGGGRGSQGGSGSGEVGAAGSEDDRGQGFSGFGGGADSGGSSSGGGGMTGGGFCFDPDTLVKMADGTEKKIKDIKLGDQTKGGEVTGVFQFKASDEIHDYKGVTVAGSHYVKEDGKFIMVQDSPISVKIDKIPVVHSLDTTERRIFIKDIEFADYNGDGIAKGFLANAGADLTGFDQEVLRQVEHRLI